MPRKSPPREVVDDPNMPPLYVNGRVNLDHFRYRIALINRACESRAVSGDPSRFNPEPFVRNIMREAELHGVTPEMITDQRSEAQVAADLYDRICETPQSIFEALDSELDAMENMMRRAVNGTAEAANARRDLALAGKAWLGVLARVRTLRTLAREPAPNTPDTRHLTATPHGRFALEASHVLRFMVYTMSVGGVDAASSPARRVLIPARHLCSIALDVHQAETRTGWDKYGIPRPGGLPVEEAIVVVPPGHGKTTYGVARMRLSLCFRPWRRWLLVHAQSMEAEKLLAYVRAGFSPNTPDGRRIRALFPDGPRLARKGNNATTMRLDVQTTMKQPTAMAYGVNAQVSGGDADELWLDDVVDQDVANSPTERNRLFDRLNATWFARLRRKPGDAEPPFRLTTTTLWHPDDPNMRRLELARQGKAPIFWSIQACGGPNSNPPFASLWPEVWPEVRLRQKYEEMRNPALYAAAYECNPTSEIVRRVSRLAYYNPASEDHRRFMSRSPIFHLSVDPAATTGYQSDFSGIVYAAEGIAEIRVIEDGNEVVLERPELRILDAFEIKATQVDLVNRIADLLADPRYPVNHVHIEAAGGMWATAQMIEDRFGIQPIVHKPGVRDKAARLQSCAGYMDAGIVGITPSVRFMGREDGPDPNYRWLYDQILMFPLSRRDHALDAITQLVNHLASQGRLPSAPSEVQTMARAGREADRRRNLFFRMIMKEARREASPTPPEVEDWEYAAMTLSQEPIP